MDKETLLWQWRQLQIMAEHAQLRLLLRSNGVTKEEIAEAVAELGTVIGDPMWCAHAEVSKVALKRWHNVLHRIIKSIE
jgi:hypothetical protein